MIAREVKSRQKKFLCGNSGQVAVEYILLLVVGVTVWLMLISQLVSRNPTSPGPIIKEWAALLNFVGTDDVESTQPAGQNGGG